MKVLHGGNNAKDSYSVTTQRLLLRTIMREDASLIVHWRSDPDNYRYFLNPHALTMEEHLSWFDNRYSSDGNRWDWLCIEKATGHAIGVFGLIRKDDGCAEINYLLDTAAQGKGYAAEAVNELLAYAKGNWKTEKAIAEIHRDNLPSKHFATRNGFIRESDTGDFILYAKKL